MSNENVLRTLYDAQARGDLDTYLSLLSDDIVLHVPGRSRIAGDYVGKEEMRRHRWDICRAPAREGRSRRRAG